MSATALQGARRFIVYSLAVFSCILPQGGQANNIKSQKIITATPSASCRSQLSLETCQKIGQMLIVGFGGLQQDEEGHVLWRDPDGLVFNENSLIAKNIKEQHIGGIILFLRSPATGAYLRERNIQNPKQTQRLVTDLENFSKRSRKEAKLEDLPLLISIDQEGGMIDRLPIALGFTQRTLIPQAFGANEEWALSIQGNVSERMAAKAKAIAATRDYANQMAVQLEALHFNLNFVPCVDLNLNPLNFVLGGRGRSFSANPDIVLDQAAEFIQAFHDKGIMATLKHFPGHGSSSQDSHEGLVNVTESYDKQKELMPYQKLIQQGYQDMIMTAHVINGQLDKTQCKAGDTDNPNTWCPGTLSFKTITTLLKEQLGFKGVVISDDMTMGAISGEYSLEIALEKALNAGVDMFIFANNTSDDTEQVVNTIVKLVKEKRVDEARIDNAYQRIVTLKKRLKKSQ